MSYRGSIERNRAVDVQVVPVRIRHQGQRKTVKRISVYAAASYGEAPEILTVPEARDLVNDLQAAITEAEASMVASRARLTAPTGGRSGGGAGV